MMDDLLKAGNALFEEVNHPCDTGDCMTCSYQIGVADMQHCKTGNDTKRACCCYHSKSKTTIMRAWKQARDRVEA